MISFFVVEVFFPFSYWVYAEKPLFRSPCMVNSDLISLIDVGCDGFAA